MLENKFTETPPIINDTLVAKTYELMGAYPIPIDPIRYPRLQQSDNIYHSNINDVLIANMTTLVPNIDIGIHKNIYTTEDLAKWIIVTKKYFTILNKLMQIKCDKEMQKLLSIEDLKEKSKVLDMNKLNQLPEDMIRHIYSFLLPETRINILLCKYPLYETALQKMTNNHLKLYLRNGIYEHYIKPLYSYSSPNRVRVKCLQKEIRIVVSFTNKKNYTDQIQMVFDEYRKAIPRTPDDNYYFQSNALRILQSIIYVAYYKGKTLQRNKKVIPVVVL
jgi:hypothetical protein